MHNNKRRWGCVLLSIMLCLMLTACGEDNVEAMDPGSSDYVTLEIVSGSTGASIGTQLEENGIIADGDAFKKYLKANDLDGRLQAGTYTFGPSMDFEEIAEILTEGRVSTVTFTIPEGLTCKQTAQKLEDQGMGDYDEFMRVISDEDFDYPWLQIAEENQYDRLEGYLLPSTYTVAIGLSEYEVIDFILRQYENYVLPLLGNDTNISKFNDTIIKASIIERESKVDDERPLVASVIENRLAKGMKLEMCSTINYIFLQETGEVHERLLYSDLENDNPYNTYKYGGLPIAPICNPGLASIEAALNPADTDYLYFVVSDELDGRNAFSSNYGDFSSDVYAYDRAKTAAN